MRFGRYPDGPLWKSVGLAALLVGGLAVFALPAHAQQAPAVPLPMPLTTPKPPSVPPVGVPSPGVPVIGTQPAPPPGYEAVPSGTIPSANMPAAPVGVAAPAPQRQL